MSRDTYQYDRYKHGDVHIDRYRRGRLVGRYNVRGEPLMHMGRRLPPMPSADRDRFFAEVRRALGLE